MIEAIIFITGAVGMVLELVGVRLMAPYFGTSMIVWTVIIGVVLGSLSLGYHIGGKRADRNRDSRELASLLLAVSIFIFAEGLTKEFVLPFVSVTIKDLGLSSLIAALYLFTGPSLFLGMILPYAIRFKINSLKKSGELVGRLYAISTVGSITGTFLGGFYLIPSFGSNKIFYLIGVLMSLLSLFLFVSNRKKKQAIKALLVLIGLIYSSSVSIRGINVVADIDSQYSRILLEKSVERVSGRPLLMVVNGRSGVQSAMYTDIDDELAARYTRFFRLGDFFKKDIKSALAIGGGAYSYPKDFLKTHPDSELDVVEVDPMMTEIAGKYFGLHENPRLTVYHQDARVFLNSNNKHYDAVYLDAFGSDITPPFSITTKEAVNKIYNSLADGGVVVLNVVSAVEGDNGKIFRAQYNTYKSVFPNVFVFSVYGIRSRTSIQNLILVAVKSDSEVSIADPTGNYTEYLSLVLNDTFSFSDLPLTDNYAPVEYYTRHF